MMMKMMKMKIMAMIFLVNYEPIFNETAPYSFDSSPWDKEGEGFDEVQVGKGHSGDVDILEDVHTAEDGVHHEPVPGHGGHLSGVRTVKPHRISSVWTLRTSKPITNQPYVRWHIMALL